MKGFFTKLFKIKSKTRLIITFLSEKYYNNKMISTILRRIHFTKIIDTHINID